MALLGLSRRAWIWTAIALAGATLAGCAARHEIIGILFNQPRYGGHPSCYWRSEVEQHSVRRHLKNVPIYGDRSSGIQRQLVRFGLAKPSLGWIEDPPAPEILRTHEKQALPVLADLLGDKDADVRFQAAEAISALLADSSNPSAEPLLLAANSELEKQKEIVYVFNRVLWEPQRARELRPRLQELLEEKKGTREYEDWRSNLANLSKRCGVDLLGDGDVPIDEAPGQD